MKYKTNHTRSAVLAALAMPLIPDYELFSERVNTFKPEKQILG